MLVQTKFYEFRQNNSGGVFHRNKDVDETVIIEAINAGQANSKAQNIGIYFNGCKDDMDCYCCGDRWYDIHSDDEGEDTLEILLNNEYRDKNRTWIYFYDGRKERPDGLGE